VDVTCEKQYNLKTDGEDNTADVVAIKVRGLLNEAGPSNMAFTDGPTDVNVSHFCFQSKKKTIVWTLQENPG
jgi:hypothetical protein